MMIRGHVAAGWEPVCDAFEANFADGGEIGAGFAAYHRGQPVVDITGGSFDDSAIVERPYDADTLQLVFSTTKGLTAICVAMCVDRGLINYDEDVTTYWPEFAAHGKGDATVAQLLSHQVGVIAPDGELTLAEALDWTTIAARLADTKPDWPIGSTHGYHALTYGWLAGELIRRTDGRTPGRFLSDEVAGPLGVEAYIGLPPALESRVAPIIGKPINDTASDPALQAMIDMFMGPATRGGRALFLNGVFGPQPDGTNVFNRQDVHAAEVPAANGIANAGALAKIYAATLGPVEGANGSVTLVSDATRARMAATVTPDGEGDACLIMPTTFGMGFMTHGPFTPYAGTGSYGHPGAGGSVAFAQPARDLAGAYVMNMMAQNLAGDVRAQRLMDAAARCADAA
jgi:CubicO group peptidase (beta-lactamase class C family)